MATAQLAKVTHTIDNNVRGIASNVQDLVDGAQYIFYLSS